MIVVGTAAALVAALVHVGFFFLESVWFSRPRIYRRFFVTSEHDAHVLRQMALNQGFYNLFLAIGAALGAGALIAGASAVGRTLVFFSCACMAAAGVVLSLTDRRFLRVSVIQALPALTAILAVAAA